MLQVRGALPVALYGGARHAVGLQVQGSHRGGMGRVALHGVDAVPHLEQLHALQGEAHQRHQQGDGQDAHYHTIHRR